MMIQNESLNESINLNNNNPVIKSEEIYPIDSRIIFTINVKQSILNNINFLNFLYQHIPNRYNAKKLYPLYNLKDGANLMNFYHHNQLDHNSYVWDGSNILIIQDQNGYIFGCFTTEKWSCQANVSDYYGNGETFVFQLYPKLITYHWSELNNSEYFQIATNEFIAIGGLQSYAIWIDKYIRHGVSTSCKTFNNISLSSTSDFTILNVECWALVS